MLEYTWSRLTKPSSVNLQQPVTSRVLKMTKTTTLSSLLLLPLVLPLLDAITVNCGRFCFWHHQSVFFCLCMKYFGNSWKDLCRIHTEDVFGPSLRWVWRWSQSLSSPGTKKRHFSALSAACVQFMFGKTSLASSINILFLFSWPISTDISGCARLTKIHSQYYGLLHWEILQASPCLVSYQ